ncbi:hypothetical protein AgCh_021987 [Apium graveolens]
MIKSERSGKVNEDNLREYYQQLDWSRCEWCCSDSRCCLTRAIAKEHKLSSTSKNMYLGTVSLFRNVYQGKGLVIKLYRQSKAKETVIVMLAERTRHKLLSGSANKSSALTDVESGATKEN